MDYILPVVDYEAMLDNLNRTIALDPDNAALYERRAFIQRRLGSPDGALADLTQAVALDPSAHATIMARIELLLEQDDYALAIADLSTVIAEQPANIAGLYQQRAGLYEALEEYRLALADYDTILALLADQQIVRYDYDEPYSAAPAAYFAGAHIRQTGW
ncbi:MAG: hypothetical protein R2867_08560 [Caldilineaceae bacterium]